MSSVETGQIKRSNVKMRTVWIVMSSMVATIMLTGCATLGRLPALPIESASAATWLDLSDARFFADGDSDRIAAIASKARERRLKSRRTSNALNFLSISGGGEDGAFGAGLLVGWSKLGRPEFDLVTGISTGALSAPFAFLGQEFDPILTKVYTEVGPDDIFQKRLPLVATLANDAVTDTAPLRRLIASYMSKDVVARIAREYAKGRLLLVLTTNLDQARAVIWNIGAIAESRHPRARELIIDILLASAAIPGVFPPVMLNVTVDGKNYQEMHVDGGMIAQAFLYPPSYIAKPIRVRGVSGKPLKRRVYVIRNGRLLRPEAEVKRQTLAISAQALSTMIASSGVNDAYRIYTTTKRDGIEFRLAYIGTDFTVPYPGPFDRYYMNALYNYGYELGRTGYPWRERPPGFAE